VGGVESNRDRCYTSGSLRGEVRVKIDISRLEHEPLQFDEELLIESERVGPDQVVGRITVHLKGEVRPRGDVYWISGRCSADGSLACSRCLEPVPWGIEEDFSFECRQNASAPLDAETVLEDRDLDVAFLEGEEFDLAELAAEQVLLAIPMRILCDSNCAGLCPSCGANLNTVDDCGCEPEVDPRWQSLADLAGSTRES
jgi:uncharacterized protein